MSTSILNLDALLDQSMEAVEAAPNFVDLETGIYILEVLEGKADKQKTKDEAKAKAEGKPLEYVVLKHQYKVIEVIQTEGNAIPVAAGSLCSDQWQLGEKGLPHFKTRTTAIAVANGEDAATVDTLTVGQCLQAVKGLTFKCSARKQERSDKPGFYNVRIENIQSVDA